MFHHLHRADQIEALVGTQRLNAAGAIVDRQPLSFGMVPRRGDILGRGVEAGRLRPHSRQRFGEQPRAAADVDRAPARQRPALGAVGAPMAVDHLAHETQPHRVQPVQHRR